MKFYLDVEAIWEKIASFSYVLENRTIKEKILELYLNNSNTLNLITGDGKTFVLQAFHPISTVSQASQDVFYVDYSSFYDILKKMRGELIELSFSSDGKITIQSSKNFLFEIPYMKFATSPFLLKNEDLREAQKIEVPVDSLDNLVFASFVFPRGANVLMHDGKAIIFDEVKTLITTAPYIPFSFVSSIVFWHFVLAVSKQQDSVMLTFFTDKFGVVRRVKIDFPSGNNEIQFVTDIDALPNYKFYTFLSEASKTDIIQMPKEDVENVISIFSDLLKQDKRAQLFLAFDGDGTFKIEATGSNRFYKCSVNTAYSGKKVSFLLSLRGLLSSIKAIRTEEIKFLYSKDYFIVSDQDGRQFFYIASAIRSE
ncbi:MAG: hypothetical protein NZM44_04135 [Candidatus Calescibacterium sp.]|nr:hypothetical protein [Candidatus Calescibacterium sp.]